MALVYSWIKKANYWFNIKNSFDQLLKKKKKKEDLIELELNLIFINLHL